MCGGGARGRHGGVEGGRVIPRRLEGWTVRPSFVPHGPTKPVTLLIDDHGLTQLAGVDPVAWQVPWPLLQHLRVVRSAFTTALVATVDGQLFVWRSTKRSHYAALTPFVVAAGGRVERARQRVGAWIGAALVVLGASAGTLGYQLRTAPGLSTAERATIKVNLTVADLPGSWTATGPSLLSALASTPNKLYTTNFATTTTLPPATSTFGQAATSFQHCFGVSSSRDRVFGKAGQSPLYQVGSPIFTSDTAGGVQVATEVQYYPRLSNVSRDTREINAPQFGSCFAQANGLIMKGLFDPTYAITTGATSTATPVTFAKGFRVGGAVLISAPSFVPAEMGATTTQSLGVYVMTQGHYEVTLYVLAAHRHQPTALVSTLVNTVVARISSSPGRVL